MFRGTIRRPGFCKAWNLLVRLGLTDNSFTIEDSENMSYRDFVNSFLAYNTGIPVEQKLCSYLEIDIDSPEMNKLRYLDIFSDEKIGLKNATPAQILQKRLEEKWQLDQGDKDMIVMQHQFEYIKEGKKKRIVSSLVVRGKNNEETAMAITVGVPVGIAAKLILNGEITSKGVKRPLEKHFYKPVLKELEEYGIRFIEKRFDIS